MKKLIVISTLVLIVSLAAAQTSLPTGTAVKMKLSTTLSTFGSKTGDSFSARVTQPVILDNKVVLPVGTTVEGRVSKVSEPRRVSGKPTIGVFPEDVVLPNGDRFTFNATLVDTSAGRGSDVNTEGQFKGEGHDATDLTQIGMGTGGGMIIGGLISGGKGLLIGGAVGATVTVAHWLGKHRSTTLPAGTELVMELNRPMVMSQSSGQ